MAKKENQKTLLGENIKKEVVYSRVPRRHPGYYKWKERFREWKKKYEADMCNWGNIPEEFKKYLRKIYKDMHKDTRF